MQITTHQQDEATVLAVSGRLDAMTAPDFEQESATVDGAKLILDLSELEYVSSAGLRSILALAKRLNSTGGSLALCNVTGLVKEVLEMSGFDSFLPIHPSLDAALAGGG